MKFLLPFAFLFGLACETSETTTNNTTTLTNTYVYTEPVPIDDVTEPDPDIEEPDVTEPVNVNPYVDYPRTHQFCFEMLPALNWGYEHSFLISSVQYSPTNWGAVIATRCQYGCQPPENSKKYKGGGGAISTECRDFPQFCVSDEECNDDTRCTTDWCLEGACWNSTDSGLCHEGLMCVSGQDCVQPCDFNMNCVPLGGGAGGDLDNDFECLEDNEQSYVEVSTGPTCNSSGYCTPRYTYGICPYNHVCVPGQGCNPPIVL